MSTTTLRPIAPADMPAVARLIERINDAPATRDLHTYETPVEVLVRQMLDLQAADRLIGLVELRDGEPTGAVLLDVAADTGRAWCWGPSASAEPDARRLLEAALDLLPAKINRVSCFPAAENLAFLAILAARGATLRSATHVYRTLPTDRAYLARDVRPACPDDLALLHVLHEAHFPASYRSAAELVAADPTRTRLLVAETAERRLAGYVAASIEADGGGYIDFLATAPAERRQGVATRLLDAALAWMFGTARVPAVHLTVSEDKAIARRLYERAGFTLHVSGIPTDLMR